MRTLIWSPMRSASIAPVTPSTPTVLVISGATASGERATRASVAANSFGEAEAQLEFLDDRQRRHETITLCVHARDHDPAARRCRVNDLWDHSRLSDCLEDRGAGRLGAHPDARRSLQGVGGDTQ